MWNSNNVSHDIINLGDGYYFISLIPITVLPGEDPILLNMTISAIGYQDKNLETYLAVDPDILDKDHEKDSTESPIIIIIVTVSIVGSVGISTLALILLRRSKRLKINGLNLV